MYYLAIIAQDSILFKLAFHSWYIKKASPKKARFFIWLKELRYYIKTEGSERQKPLRSEREIEMQ
jgi:hypothetical protein